MKLVLDLQGAQSESRFRGIGRYSMALARAIAIEAQARDRAHEVILALNARLPDIEAIRTDFAQTAPQSRVAVFDIPGPTAEHDAGNAWRARAAELVREQFLAGLQPDIVHVSSLFEGYVDDAVCSVGVADHTLPTAATLYDLIPLLRPETYLAQPGVRAYYLRKLQSLKRTNLLLAISESSRVEAIDALHIPPERITTIAAGIDPMFRPTTLSPEKSLELRKRYGLETPFVLYAGAADPRKNIAALIDAFGRLPPVLRNTHRLAVVGRLDANEQAALRAAASSLPPGTLVLTGYVPDPDLVALYGLCAVMVFPSLHEGFGFPAAEAMACGAAVITSNRTSLPEIVARADALFDPHNPDAIAALMTNVLTDEALREDLRATGPQRASRFTWENAARKSLDAFEMMHERRRPRPAAEFGFRPRLAVIAPLPPEQSGVADYVAQQLPELAAYYDIVCIVAQTNVVEDWIVANFPVHDIAWFEQNAVDFDRVLYHFGNSPFHAHMFDLLARVPGIVILHDFYLSGALRWMSRAAADTYGFDRAIVESHGISGLLAQRALSGPQEAELLPCSGQVIALADTVLVHSHHAIELAHSWYGEAAARKLIRVPYLRIPHRDTNRSAARQRLGLSPDDFVVCTFGWVAPTKLNHRLMEGWLAAGLDREASCHLFFVGENHGGDYGERLQKIIVRHGAGRVKITGFLDDAAYCEYRAASNAAVQLRTLSRGETSGAIFDCLSQGIPLVINAHGSAAELPADILLRLDESFSTEELADALLWLYRNQAEAHRLGARGLEYVRRELAPARVAACWHDALETGAFCDAASERRTINRIAALQTGQPPAEADLAAVSSCIVSNRPAAAMPRLLYDVTALAANDLRTGIERVTRSLLVALLENPPAGLRVEPVRATEQGYVHAFAYTRSTLDLAWCPADRPVHVRSGDVLLIAEWTPYVFAQQRNWIVAGQARGISLIQMVFDLLPAQRPDLFPNGIGELFSDWLTSVSAIADGMVCISGATEAALREWLDTNPPARARALRIGVCNLGADIAASLPTRGLPPDAAGVARAMAARPTFLMVGTVEPRKGHEQVLNAFEHLWAQGADVALVVAGKPGWNTGHVIRRFETHAERGRRLLWLGPVSDDMLDQLYKNSKALLAASVNEGFGLPLIEAARHRIPILARDIPVFREVAGPHASYFHADDPAALAQAIRRWLDDERRGAVPGSAAMTIRTWAECASGLARMLQGEGWHHPWQARDETAAQ